MDDEETKLEKPFHVDRAKTGRAGCKKCKQKIDTGELRLGKLGYNPFSSGTMKYWHHVQCMFEVFKKQRKTTKKIDSFSEIEGWEKLPNADKETIKSYFSAEELKEIEANTLAEEANPAKAEPANDTTAENKDNSFRTFRKICSELTQASSYLTKTSIVKDFFDKGSDGKGFKGNLHLWCRSLLPMASKRVYNLQSKQLVKIFSDIFRTSQEEMLEDLEQGDVAETVSKFFEQSKRVDVAKKAILTLGEVDTFLEYLAKLTREADQIDHFKSILPKCTSNDLKIIVRLIKHDLRINAGPKHILEALDPKAYPAFQASRDLQAVVDSVLKGKKGGQSLKVGISIMTPVLPMLAEACSSVEMAFRKCPDGMYSEIKYDGERVQLHKQGDTFKYFSRSLKPVLSHKVSHFEKYIPKAFPHGKDLILDSEILMVDTETGNPLPFGTLGAHKKNEFKNASVCLFVFDCIYYNGESLIDKPIKERRSVLMQNMTEITNHVMFSEVQEIHTTEDLENMMEKVFRQGLEGLVLKPLLSRYEPGKRHWLKVKKDYLAGGSMADTADLVVLGAWFGTGKKGGIMSVFLMGCHDEKRRRWVTVTKVHGGHDDKTLEKLQTELQMNKIGRDATKVPSWLHCAKTMVPDFVAKDPKKSPVWEITGAEFTCNQVHTADGISIRFPRVTRIRNDKTWETATSLAELKKIYEASKDTSGFTLKGKTENNDSPDKKDAGQKRKDEEPKEPSKKPKKEEKAKTSSNDGQSSKRKHDEDKKEAKKKQKTAYDEDTDSDGKTEKQTKKESDLDSYGSETEDDENDSKKEGSSSSKQVKIDEQSKESSKMAKDSKKSGKDEKLRSSSETKRSNRKHDDDKSAKRHKATIDYEPDTDSDDQSKDKEKNEDKSSEGNKRNNKSLEKRQHDKEAESKDGRKKDKKSSEQSESGSDTEIDEDPAPNAHVTISMKNKLPDVFTGYVICLHKSVGDKDMLRRFVIAYNGRIFSEKYQNSLENDGNKITHYVYPSRHVKERLDIKGQDGGKHVSVDWLWDSIKKVKCLPEHDYRIKLT